MIQIPELWVKAKGTGPSSKACSFLQLPQATVGEKAQPTAATGCWFGISTEPQIKPSPLNSYAKTKFSRLSVEDEAGEVIISFVPNSWFLRFPETHLLMDPIVSLPTQLQPDRPGLPPRGRRGPAMAAHPL